MLQQFLKEPLLHFVLLGSVTLALDAWRATPESQEAHAVVVSAQRKAALVQDFETRFKRLPTAQESAALVDDYVNAEILLKEGRLRQLNSNDPVVRRRIIQQMTLLLQERGGNANPTLNQMEAWMNAHSERYTSPQTISFEHRFFSRSTNNAMERAKDINNLGQAFPLGPVIKAMPYAKVRAQFGEPFAKSLSNAGLNQWSEVLESKLGLHRVRVTRRVDGALPPLDRVRGKVLKDMTAHRRKMRLKAGMEELRKRYTVTLP